MNPLRRPLSFVAAAAVLVSAAAALPADTGGAVYAVRNCRIVPVSGPPIAKGVLVLRAGLIESLGAAEKTPIPPDAEIVEGEGLTAYPGLILAHSHLFIDLPRREGPGGDAAVPTRGAPAAAVPREDRFPPGPGLCAYDMLAPKAEVLESWHKAGVTAALVAPPAGIFQGRSVLINLNGGDKASLVLRNPHALHLDFTVARGEYPSSLMGTVALIRQKFLDARHYALAQGQYAKTPAGLRRPAYDPDLEALLPYARDGQPVFFHCRNLEDVKRALRMIGELGLNGVVTGANEAWRAADALKTSPRPLLVALDFRPPAASRYATRGEDIRKKAEAEIYPGNAAALFRAGIPFALTALGLDDGPAFLKAVRAAVDAGLPADKALEALTLQPARFLGVEAQLGSLQPGKIADVILVRGELFGEKAKTEQVFVDGRRFRYEEKGR